MADDLQEVEPLSLDEIEATADRIQRFVERTPVCRWAGPELVDLVGAETEVHLKLEQLQRSGTFKARGALNNILSLHSETRRRGVTAVSAGNHAIAVAYAASILDVSAKVVMQNTASPARVEAARRYGAEVLLEEPGPPSFKLAERIATEEGRTFVHPFEGRATALGTATLGREIAEQLPDLDALLVAVGGGGLAAGVASAFKLLQPDCSVIGVEPEGADSMSRSIAAGETITMTPKTIADSLAPPMSLPFSFALCRDNLDDVVKVSDSAIQDAMGLLFRDMKLAVEPACAATTAALVGPLKDRLEGKKIGLILCGSNMDLDTFYKLTSPKKQT